MKQFVRIGVLCAAAAALALGAVAPAGAGGYPEHGTVIITPDPAKVGSTVTIANAGDEDSTCDDYEFEDVVAYVWVSHSANEAFEEFFEVPVDNDTGLWSFEFTIPNDDAAIGEWVVDAVCDWPGDTEPLAHPPFLYNLANFDVIGETPVEPPEEGTAPAEEVRAAPRFTG